MVDDSEEEHNRANVPDILEEWPNKLWSMVEQANQGSHTFASAPMEEIYADPNQYKVDTNSIFGYIGSAKSHKSIDEDLKELPQYLGEHEAKSKIRVLPSI